MDPSAPMRDARRIPVSYERALTAVIQGRNAIERARREFSEALEILAQLQARTEDRPTDAELLRGLRHALDQLEASCRSLDGPTVPAPPPAIVQGLG